jgi:hypothetical protein
MKDPGVGGNSNSYRVPGGGGRVCFPGGVGWN